MQISIPSRAPGGRRPRRLVALLCAVMLDHVLWTFAVVGRAPAGAATVGTATAHGRVRPAAAPTPFSLHLPAGAACTGDSASGGYRVQTYMVPEAGRPGQPGLRPHGADRRVRAASSACRSPAPPAARPFANQGTASADRLIRACPGLNFALFSLTSGVLAGTYNVGVACTVGTGADQVLDKYWNARLTVDAEPSRPPAGFTGVPADAGTTTTTAGGTTTTTADGGTTTTTPMAARPRRPPMAGRPRRPSGTTTTTGEPT